MSSFFHVKRDILNLDMLTYIPFEKLGYSYLNGKLTKENSNVIEFKYNKMIKLLSAADLTVDEELKEKIDYFLNKYYNDVIEININDYLPEFDYSNKLSDDMIKYL